MSRRSHLDSHELDDWPLYGPRNPEIAWLVLRLAEQHGMRLADIEAIILAALTRQLAVSEGAPDDAGTTDYELGHNLAAQQELLLRAYETGDKDRIEQVLIRVSSARRVNKTGALEWQNPEDGI